MVVHTLFAFQTYEKQPNLKSISNAKKSDQPYSVQNRRRDCWYRVSVDMFYRADRRDSEEIANRQINAFARQYFGTCSRSFVIGGLTDSSRYTHLNDHWGCNMKALQQNRSV